MDACSVGGQSPVTRGAGGAIHILQEKAAAVLHDRARLCDSQVTDGDCLRK